MRKNSDSNLSSINYKYIGKRLSELRNEFGIKKVNMAQYLGLDDTGAIGSIESGKSMVRSIRAIIFFAKEKKINPAWILLEDNGGQPKYLLTEGSSIKTLQDENRILREGMENLISLLNEKGIKLNLKKESSNTQIFSQSEEEEPIEKP